MPPFSVNTDRFHAAPIAAFPSGYVEIMTSKRDGKVKVSKVSVMGMNLEEQDEKTKRKRKKLSTEQTYDALAKSVCDACSGAGLCGVAGQDYDDGLRPILKKNSTATKSPLGIFSCKRVRFDSLYIRRHPMTLGDHPSAISGPPVTLDWKTIAEDQIVDLDTYERGREPRRNRMQLRMSLQEREDFLIQEGFTFDQVKGAWEESLRVRKQRYESLKSGRTSRLWSMLRFAW